MDVDVAALTPFVGVASLVPAVLSSRHGDSRYRPWFARAVVMLVVGLGCAALSLFEWLANDLLFWLGALLVAAGALVVWALRFRTWRGPRQADMTSRAS
jgi:protein-S-isoprenylcysteine O-methyltransferase Ste14